MKEINLPKPIYLDYAATTPVDPRVANKMADCLTMDGCFGNPASNTHEYGFAANAAIERARQQVAELINADSKEIIWTSGATESDNLALQGVMNFYRQRGNHLITVKTEHKAVLDTCKFLETQGFEVTYLKPQTDGLIDLAEFESAITKKTVLASVMHVNNETGVIQDIKAISNICKKHKMFLHVDAAQSAGKILVDVKEPDVDLMSFSSHKVYGPKGMGALYVRRKPKVRLQPIIFGGGHEQGLRSGTLATHQIVGMGEAFTLAKNDLAAESQRILNLKNKLLEKLKVLPDIFINGNLQHVVPGILNVSFAGLDGSALLHAIKNLAVSTGSACTSADITPSHVLQAMGVSNVLAHNTLRISIGRFTTESEIDFAANEIIEKVRWLREMAP